MIIPAEIQIDETGILEQMENVKKAGDIYEDEMLKLRGMILRGKATTKSIKNGDSEESPRD